MCTADSGSVCARDPQLARHIGSRNGRIYDSSQPPEAVDNNFAFFASW